MADLQSDISLAKRFEAIGHGELSALRELYEATSSRLLVVCLAVIGSREAAEDVLRDLYLAVWDRGASFDRSGGSAWLWLISKAREIAIDSAQARSRRDLSGGETTPARDRDDQMDVLAAGLALDVLGGEKRSQAEARRAQEPDFAAAVAQWESVRQSCFDGQQEQVPSGVVWQRIQAGLDRNAAPVPVQARYLEPHEVSETVQSSIAWKTATIVASLAALAFALMWLFDQPDRISVPVEVPVEGQFDPGRLSVAQINGGEAGTLLSALYDRQTGKLYLRLSGTPAEGRMPQLWLLDAQGTPRSLGFGGRASVKELQLTPDQQKVAAAGGSIAISLEEPSPTIGDTPTEIVGSAQLAPFNSATPAT